MRNDIHTEIISYKIEDKLYKGFIAIPSNENKAPGILVAHAWKGLDHMTRKKTLALAELGFIAFALDLYGEGRVAESDEEATQLMRPLSLDRSLLQTRMQAGYEVLAKHSLVDHSKIGAIGFCFGGLAAIELLRSGTPISGVVSFHASLSNQMQGQLAKTCPIASGIKGKLLILHGHDDPLVSPADLLTIQTEMTVANIDWQVHIFGHTSHAFTNDEVHDPASGLVYNPSADRRSWLYMRNFFEEIFI